MAKTKKETVKTKTIKPSGVKITRKDETFTLAWKIADADYADGIAVQYRTNLQGWTTLATGKTATSRAVKLAVGNYFPSRKKYLQWVEMRVRGNRKTHKKKFKRKKKTIEQTIIPSVSDWAVAKYTLAFPKQPSLSAALDSELTNKTTFTWSVSADSTSAPWFRGYYWETQLVKDCATGDGSKLAWNRNRLGWQSGTAGTSKVIVEDTAVIESGSYTRWFRVQARGPRGSSYWRYAKHIYALPYQAVTESAVATVQDSGGFQCKVVWTAAAPYAHPIDKTTVEYSIATPDEGLSCPDEASWTAARVSADTGNKDMAVFPIDTALAVDKCLFVRVNTEHDGVMTYGVPRLVTGGVGVLAKPTLTSVVLGDNHMVTINATNASAVPDSFLVVLYRPASNPTSEISIGIMEHGQTSKSFQAPDWDEEDSYAFGVYAAVGDPETITQDSALIKSDIEWGEGDVPKAPANVKVSATSVTGTIRVEWDWTWDKADGAELSWSDHEDAWESTDEPERYEISSIHSSHWNISGLETGMKWYVKVRFKKGMGDNETYGPYSDAQIIDLTSAPSIPTLVLSSGVITESGSVTASWVYTTTDGTQQAYAEICEATITTSGIIHGSYKSSTDLYPIESKKYYQLVSGEYVEVQNIVYPDEDHRGDNPQEQGWLEYRDIIAKTDSVQHVTLSAEELGWKTGETYNLCVRVISASGRVSDEWSSPVPIMIAEPLQVAITEHPFVAESETLIVDGETVTREYLSLKEMPLTLTVEGAGENGTVSIVIERAAAYYINRPDETRFTGYENETIALYSQQGDGEITITDLIGALDDGAQYRLIATLQDDLGQSAETSIDFEVHWTHQALIPDGSMEIDEDNYIAKITPIAPTHARVSNPQTEDIATYYELIEDEYVLTQDVEVDPTKTYYIAVQVAPTDVCDIYRLSADRPQLIVKDGAFGTTYVDPYMAIGDFGGYRLVFRTANGDYITENNEIAWLDLDEDILEIDYTVIDFAEGQIELFYNVDVSSTWTKDFTETKYLGGSVQGDWNPAVSRTGQISAVMLTITDKEQMQQIHRLAVDPSLCHVRTKDGASYAADVQVAESYSHEKEGLFAIYTFTITRVDTEQLDGMTLQQWEEFQETE